MKKYILSALLLLSSPLAFSDSQGIGGSWLGLHNGDSSIMIGDNEAQSLQDVDLTVDASGIKKRAGYTQFQTVGTSTWAVRGEYFFRDSSGNDTLVAANNTSLYKSINGGTYTSFVTTDTAGSYYSFSDSNGTLWRADSNNDQILSYDGSVVTYSTSIPKGSVLTISPDRLIISGTTANPNRVYFSQSAAFGNFDTGILNSSPFTEDFGLPGQKITVIKYALGRLLVWTKNTMSYWSGTDQFDGVIQDISQTIGCDQPGTVLYDNGIVFFQAQDRHYYAYDGNTLQKISRPITGSVLGMVHGTTKNVTLTTQSDFGPGTFSIGMSSITSPGDVVMSTDTIDDFADGDYTSNPTWSMAAHQTSTVTIVNNEMVLTSTGPSSGEMTVYTANSVSTGIWTFQFRSTDTTATATFSLCSGVPSNFHYFNSGCYTLGMQSGFIYIDVGNGNGSISPIAGPALFDGSNHTIGFEQRPGGILNGYFDGVLTISSATTQMTSIPYIAANGLFFANNKSVVFDNFRVSPYGGSYQSPVLTIGNAITGWGQFAVNNVLDNGTISYAIYTDTNTSITISDKTSWISSQAVTSGQIPTLGTAPYVTWTANFNRSASTQTPTLNDVTVNWYEGSITHHWGAVDKDHRLMWSVAEGTATVPNATYIYDQRFSSWLKYSFPLDVPIRYGDTLYFGGVSTGVVYLWPSGNSDNGSAINAFWKSKDFIGSDPYLEKDFRAISLIAKTQSGSSLNLDYYVNGVTTSSGTFTTSLTSPISGSYIRRNERLPNGTAGSFINFQFGNNAADSPFEIYALKFDYIPRAWRAFSQ